MRHTCYLIAFAVGIAAPAVWGQEDGPEVLEVPPPPATVADTGELDVLTRGPVHEAFAEQVTPNPTPGIVVPKAPPEPIEELPPEVKPEGDDVVWVPGYWFWSEDRNDYVWVTGVWRRIPPGRRWVSGYWQETSDGYQYVSGFWDQAEAPELEYLETPPESLDAGPSSPAPSEDYFWVPGNWELGSNRYQWRAGYWHGYEDGWTWVNDRYIWTPRGCVFVRGYWDYTLPQRGCLFAPVYYHSPVYAAAGYRYRPSYCIGFDSLLLHLFVRPRCHHYYFGDYYASTYRTRNYYPCYDYAARWRGFDPLYTYYQHHYGRFGIDYIGRARGWHDYYAHHADRRPPHTYGAQIRLAGTGRADRIAAPNHVAHRLTDDLPHHRGQLRLNRIPVEQRERLGRDATRLRAVAATRRQFELPARRPDTSRPESGPAHLAKDGAKGPRRARLVLPQAVTRPMPKDHPVARASDHARTRGAVVRDQDPRPGVSDPTRSGDARSALQRVLREQAERRAQGAAPGGRSQPSGRASASLPRLGPASRGGVLPHFPTSKITPPTGSSLAGGQHGSGQPNRGKSTQESPGSQPDSLRKNSGSDAGRSSENRDRIVRSSNARSELQRVLREQAERRARGQFTHGRSNTTGRPNTPLPRLGPATRGSVSTQPPASKPTVRTDPSPAGSGRGRLATGQPPATRDAQRRVLNLRQHVLRPEPPKTTMKLPTSRPVQPAQPTPRPTGPPKRNPTPSLFPRGARPKTSPGASVPGASRPAFRPRPPVAGKGPTPTSRALPPHVSKSPRPGRTMPSLPMARPSPKRTVTPARSSRPPAQQVFRSRAGAHSGPSRPPARGSFGRSSSAGRMPASRSPRKPAEGEHGSRSPSRSFRGHGK